MLDMKEGMGGEKGRIINTENQMIVCKYKKNNKYKMNNDKIGIFVGYYFGEWLYRVEMWRIKVLDMIG